MANIVIVDDEERIRVILKIMLNSHGHDVKEASDGREALALLEKEPFDLVITDIRMDGLSGMDLLNSINDQDLGVPVIFITAFASMESAIDAFRLGATDYLVKPFDEKQVHLTVERALGVGKLIAENVRLKKILKADGVQETGVFISSGMIKVKEMAMKVAESDATVLITGESGSGKEVVARLIHNVSNRNGNRFVAVNCAAISPTLVESELFGHEKGAFTGANSKKEGKFEYADQGTLFLDEVGDLPLEAQAKLLRAIQERSFQRVGGNREIPVDTRLVCATNQDLGKLVLEKKFRQDLYYRLAVFPIHVPPLRERKKAIPALVAHFVKKSAKVRELTTDILTPGAVRILIEFPWPGNVRELANALERVMILKSGKLPITSDDLTFLTFSISNQYAQVSVENLFKLPATGVNFEDLQRDIVKQALDLTAGNQSAASRLLGLSRAKFRTFLKLLDS